MGKTVGPSFRRNHNTFIGGHHSKGRGVHRVSSGGIQRGGNTARGDNGPSFRRDDEICTRGDRKERTNRTLFHT